VHVSKAGCEGTLTIIWIAHVRARLGERKPGVGGWVFGNGAEKMLLSSGARPFTGGVYIMKRRELKAGTEGPRGPLKNSLGKRLRGICLTQTAFKGGEEKGRRY